MLLWVTECQRCSIKVVLPLKRLNARTSKAFKKEKIYCQIYCQGALYLPAQESLPLLIHPLTLKVWKSIRGGWVCQRCLRPGIGWIYFWIILAYFHCLTQEKWQHCCLIYLWGLDNTPQWMAVFGKCEFMWLLHEKVSMF